MSSARIRNRRVVVTEVLEGRLGDCLLTTRACRFVISKIEVLHPGLPGFAKHFEADVGQISDYRVPLSDGREFHVKEYEQNYSAHWNNSSAVCNPPSATW